MTAGGGPRADRVALRTLTPDEAPLVPAVWRAAWAPGADGPADGRLGATRAWEPSPYPLEERVWRERLAAHHAPELLIGAFAGPELVGVAYGRLPTAAWLPSDVGWVSLLAVAAAWQGMGVGTRLFTELAGRLRAAGAIRFRLGSEANHLLPGLPQEAPAAAWRLARRAGARFTAAEHDLHLDLVPPLPAAPLPAGWRVRDDDPAGALAFVARAFPGRWTHEVEAYLAAGATVLTLVDEHAGGTPDGRAQTRGFCAVFTGDERLVGPQLYWRLALPGRQPLRSSSTGPEASPALGAAQPSGARVGGMGPLGVEDSARGGGLGLAMVRAGAEWLKERGCTDAVINWTTLTTFYGKLGARVWRTYQRAEGPL